MPYDSIRHEAKSVVVEISRRETDFLYDPSATARVIRALRWEKGNFCPRCKTTAVKRINTFFVNELFQCSACNYNFNCTSGTIFQGSKLPLNRHLLLLMASDLFCQTWSIRDIAIIGGVSERTAKLQIEKRGQPPQNHYLHGPYLSEVRRDDCSSMLDLFERNAFSVDMPLFLDRLRNWLRM
ncbi:MAG: transposase [Rhizobium sp.]|nr:transposase [Rhizobium sp.]